MPAGPDSLRTEVALLKRQVAALEGHLLQIPVREAQVGERRNPRLAITVPDPYGVYPDISTEPDTYCINFIDGSFTRAQGQQGNTQRKRQKDGEEFGFAQNTMGGTADAYVPEGSLIEVTAEVTPTGLKQWWFTRIDPEQDDPSNGDSSGDTTIDVLICEPWNRCTDFLIFPQRRLHLPPGTTIETLPNGVVPLNVCESSDPPPPPPSNGGPPSDSIGDSSSGSGGHGWTDIDIVWDTLIVEGNLTPAGATGEYSRGLGYYNGRPFWYKYGVGGTYMVWWNPVWGGFWQINKIGDDENYWYKSYEPDTPVGYYSPSLTADGIATVTQGGLP